MFKGLLVLIRERFPLVQYGPMILVFAIANGFYFTNQDTFSKSGLIVSIIILFSAFLRLRLFDEIKDYETDLKINPHRPLARGVLTRDQVKIAILLLIILEIILTSYLGLAVFFVHAVAIGYSLLMFEEFFIGTYLRPHLTTYAVIHTFVSALLGGTVAFGSMQQPQLILGINDVVFCLSHWMFFNIFEFARKTYASEEERSGVDTYSSLFGIKGAVALTLSQVVLGLFLIAITSAMNIVPLYILGALYILISLIFVIKKSKAWAGVFRHTSGAYLLLHYALLAWLIGKDHL